MNILVSGGASGLGESITKRLSKDLNNKVYFTYNSSFGSATRISNEFANTIPIKCDFRKKEEVKELTALVQGIDLDVLINNAYCGEYLQSYFHKQSPGDYLDSFIENIIPVIELTQTAIDCFRIKKKGKIITVLTSALKDSPPIGSSIYIANKAYLERLTKVWAKENAKFNITSNSVSPSFMQTRLTSGIDQRIVEQITEQRSSKELLKVEEVAEVINFLVRDHQKLNGVDIPMD